MLLLLLCIFPSIKASLLEDLFIKKHKNVSLLSDTLFKVLDYNNDGNLNFTEWKHAHLMPSKAGYSCVNSSHSISAFAVYDEDSNAGLSTHEFYQYLIGSFSSLKSSDLPATLENSLCSKKMINDSMSIFSFQYYRRCKNSIPPGMKIKYFASYSNCTLLNPTEDVKCMTSLCTGATAVINTTVLSLYSKEDADNYKKHQNEMLDYSVWLNVATLISLIATGLDPISSTVFTISIVAILVLTVLQLISQIEIQLLQNKYYRDNPSK